LKNDQLQSETIPLVCGCGHTLHVPAFNEAYYKKRILELEEQIRVKDQQLAALIDSKNSQHEMPISLEEPPLKILIAYKNSYPKIPTYDDIESLTGYTRSTISSGLKTLEAKKLLIKTNQTRSITRLGVSLAEIYIEKMKNKN